MKILMVCIGNICRSPIAEGVLKKLAKEEGCELEVKSAALMNYHIGKPPHQSSQKICQQKGVDISHQRARLFQKADFENFDVIFALATDIEEELKRLASQNTTHLQKIKLLMNEVEPESNLSVPDPYYGDWHDYEIAFDMIHKASQAFLENIKASN